VWRLQVIDPTSCHMQVWISAQTVCLPVGWRSWRGDVGAGRTTEAAVATRDYCVWDIQIPPIREAPF